MKQFFGIFTLVVLFQWAGFQNAYADVDSDSPYQFSFIHPIQFIDDKRSIHGIRVNLGYGINHDVSGLDIGLFNRTKHSQRGLQVGFFNNTLKMTGLQVGLVNYTNFLNGVQIGLLNFHTQGRTDFFPVFNFSF
jgi:hypothetical protein